MFRDGKVEEVDSSVKENKKPKKSQVHSTHEVRKEEACEQEEGRMEKKPRTKSQKRLLTKSEMNFPSLKKEMPTNEHEAYGTPNSLSQKRKSTHHILIKKLNVQYKEKILKMEATRRKDQITYKGRPVKITPDFSMETLKTRRAC